jgi:AcrR family transcriptional regulator
MISSPVDEGTQLSKGERTRQAILEQAAARASELGLESLSLGTLAEDLEMSKSGLFAHFGSREELQLATIEYALGRFLEEVIDPVHEVPAGIEQLRGLCESWLSYVERGVFPGGCFFSTVTSEFSNRPGVVRDRLEWLMNQWLARLERAIRAGKSKGQIKPEINTKRFAFELFSIGDTASVYYGVFGSTGISNARRAISERIDDAAT